MPVSLPVVFHALLNMSEPTYFFCQRVLSSCFPDMCISLYPIMSHSTVLSERSVIQRFLASPAYFYESQHFHSVQNNSQYDWFTWSNLDWQTQTVCHTRLWV